jgi:hypothetical protein
MQWLHDNGQRNFESQKSAAYYQLLLKRPGGVDPDVSARHHVLALKDIDSSHLPALKIEAQPARKRKRDETIDGDDGDPLPLLAPAPLAICDDGSPSSSSSSSSSSSHSDDGSHKSDSVDGDGPAEFVFPNELCGYRLRKETHADTGHAGLRATCPVHGECRKFRAVGKMVPIFGPMAPAYFLGAWCKAAARVGPDNHAAYMPDLEEIRVFIRDDVECVPKK